MLTCMGSYCRASDISISISINYPQAPSFSFVALYMSFAVIFNCLTGKHTHTQLHKVIIIRYVARPPFLFGSQLRNLWWQEKHSVYSQLYIAYHRQFRPVKVQGYKFLKCENFTKVCSYVLHESVAVQQIIQLYGIKIHSQVIQLNPIESLV